MKFDKKVIESGIVAAFALAVMSTSTLNTKSAPYSDQYAQVNEMKAISVMGLQEETYLSKVFNLESLTSIKENEVKTYLKKENSTVVAGVSLAVEEITSGQVVSKEEPKEEQIVELAKNEQTVALEDKVEDESTENQTQDQNKNIDKEEQEVKEKTEELKIEEEQQVSKESDTEKDEVKETASAEWESKLIPNVDEFLNVRAEANGESEVVGKLYKGSLAEIIETGDEWTKVSSGNVEGYVKNEFCAFDNEAERLADEHGTTYATALTNGLRVRAEANQEEDTKILDVLEEGKKVKVDKEAEQIDGWVAIEGNEQTAYISEDFVEVELELGQGITIEEEEAIRAAEREAEEREAAERAAQEAASAESTSSSSSSSSDSSSSNEETAATSTQNSPVEASYDDVTLLGALIQCEAGGESYEGQLAVGAVVMNRVRSGYAGSISGVIYQSGQFTPASSGALASTLANGVSGSCLSAAQEAIGGASNIGGATSFRRAGNHDGIVIGNHVFW